MYDLIGDIHGYAEPLITLLEKLGYQKHNNVWQHPKRKAIFVGDYIDRGPAIRETLQVVKGMADADSAIALLGNHEYNALAYAHVNRDGHFLREHNEKNNHQHSATIKAFSDHPGEWETYLAWFKTLPLYFETESLRAVHACWDDNHIEWLKKHNVVSISEEFLEACHKKEGEAYDVVNDILKGKEVPLPEGHTFFDKDGTNRKEVRCKWWLNAKNSAYKDFIFDCPTSLEELAYEGQDVVAYASDAPPVFFGHYWLKDAAPQLQGRNVICLDYSIAKNGQLVAYRWNPGEEISEKNFVSTGAENL